MRRKLLIWLTLAFIAVTTPIISPASVMAGLAQQKPLPPGTKTVNTYTVKRGDTLWTLANQLGVKLSDLISENQIKNPRLLQIGKVLTYTTWNLSNGTSLSSAHSSGGTQTIAVESRNTDPMASDHSQVPYTKLLYCTLTAYTAGPESTGKWPGDKGYGITSTGQTAEQGVTVAVDPSIIPYGTKLYIPGVGYRVAGDTGGAIVGDHIDVFYNHVTTAVHFGVKYHQKVYILPNWFHIPIS